VSSSNLPPGVTSSMVPGNRPEDVWHDTFLENLEVPEGFVGEMDPKALAQAINIALLFMAATRDQAFKLGEQEAKMAFDSEGPFSNEECGAIQPELYVVCQRDKGHHGDHRWRDQYHGREEWWPN